MSGMLMLDVMIGLFFIYFLLAVVCSGLVELWFQWRNTRAKLLDQRLLRLLGPKLKEAFDAHPGIRCLRQKSSRLPSEIPEPLFAQAVQEILNKNTALAAMPHWGIRTDSQEALKTDFSHAIARLSGTFRRKAQLRLLLVSFVVVAATGTDSLHLVNKLASDAHFRNLVAGEAATFVEKQSNTASDPKSPASDSSAFVAKEIKASIQNSAIFVLPQDWPWLREKRSDSFCQFFIWLLGCLLSMAAIQMGADYWFQMLTKALALRNQLRGGGAGGTAPQPPAPSDPQSFTPQSATEPIDVRSAGTAQQSRSTAYRLPPLGILASPPVARRRPLAQAALLAHFSQQAYHDHPDKLPPGIAARLFAFSSSARSRKPLDLQVWLLHPHVTQGETPAWAVLAYRGTEPTELRDWLTDAKFKQKKQDKGHVHCGFAESEAAAWSERAKDHNGHFLQQTLAELNPKQLWLTGHSLGGALAVLTALRCDEQRQIKVGETLIPLAGIATFGQPRCTDSALCKQLDVLFGLHYLRFVNHRDLVPRVPPRVAGFWKRFIPKWGPLKKWKTDDYEHAGYCIYFDQNGDSHDQAGLWQRLVDAVPVGRESWKEAILESIQDHDMKAYQALVTRIASESATS